MSSVHLTDSTYGHVAKVLNLSELRLPNRFEDPTAQLSGTHFPPHGLSQRGERAQIRQQLGHHRARRNSRIHNACHVIESYDAVHINKPESKMCRKDEVIQACTAQRGGVTTY